MNRRRFLKQTGCVAVGGLSLPYLVSSSALGKAGAVAASERITVGFIGTGGHGIDMNLKSFLAQPDAQAVAQLLVTALQQAQLSTETSTNEAVQALPQRAVRQPTLTRPAHAA